MASSPSFLSSLLLFLLSLSPHYLLLSSTETPTATPFKGVSLDNPILRFAAPAGYACERVRVAGLSRLNLWSYPSSFHVTLKASEWIQEKIGVCFHRNASLIRCRCGEDRWEEIQKGEWSAVMSPYGNRYVDLRFKGKASGSAVVSVEEEFQQWRLVFLGLGFVLLLLAPIVSNWVPFYYSSSMALGVLLVVLLILFQGMKLLPMGRKNIIYLTIYGSVLGVGSFIAHYFSTAINSILMNMGLTEEMHNPVSVFLLVGVVLAGAALGSWIVRKFVLSEDGSVDAGIAQFVKWGMRVLATVCIFQSTLDTLLAVCALFTLWCFCSLITSRMRQRQQKHLENGNQWLRRPTRTSPKNTRAEFLGRPTMKNSGKTVRRSPNSTHAWFDSPVKGLVHLSPEESAHQREDYYSTFHKTPTRCKFTKKEWEEFTRESTREALEDWASTPEVAKWLSANAHRMQLLEDSGDNESMESSSGSSEETEVESDSCLSFFKWY